MQRTLEGLRIPAFGPRKATQPPQRPLHCFKRIPFFPIRRLYAPISSLFGGNR